MFILLVTLFEFLILATTILCIVAGLLKASLADYYILLVNTISLKASNRGLPIYNYYRLYLTTHCSSNYNKHSNSYFDVTCLKASSNSILHLSTIQLRSPNISSFTEKSFLSDLISRDIQNSSDSSNFISINITTLIPKELDQDFKRHNLGFYVAYSFYIVGASFSFSHFVPSLSFFLTLTRYSFML